MGAKIPKQPARGLSPARKMSNNKKAFPSLSAAEHRGSEKEQAIFN